MRKAALRLALVIAFIAEALRRLALRIAKWARDKDDQRQLRLDC
jgi:hypothetical protein